MSTAQHQCRDEPQTNLEFHLPSVFITKVTNCYRTIYWLQRHPLHYFVASKIRLHTTACFAPNLSQKMAMTTNQKANETTEEKVSDGYIICYI